MKMMRTPLALGFALTLAGNAFAGGQQIAVETAKDGGSLLVRTYHCGTPAEIRLTGSAEGVVNGQPRSVELTLARTNEPGVFAVSRQWPAEGAWVLTFTNERGAFVNALVELQPGAALKITSQESSRTKLTRPRIDAALKRLASR
jgi:hypothetical protein